MNRHKLNIAFFSAMLCALLQCLTAMLFSKSMLLYRFGYTFSYLIPISVVVLMGQSSQSIKFDRKTHASKLCVLRKILLIFPIMVAFSTAVSSIFDVSSVSAVSNIFAILFSAVAVPILEEVYWRGCLFASLSNYGIIPAMIVSSLLFGSLHSGHAGLIYATFSGMMFSYMYLVSGSLIPTILLHVLNNACALAEAKFNHITLILVAASVILYFVFVVLRIGKDDERIHFTAKTRCEFFAFPMLYITIMLFMFIRIVG